MSNVLKLLTPKEALEAFKAKKVQGAESGNLRYHEFFDRQPYAQAGQLLVPFFTRAPASVSEDDCNLRSGKPEMPSTQAFITCGISCHFEPGADQTSVGASAATSLLAIDDFLAVERSGRLIFKAGSREDYVENGPLARFPPMTQPMFGGALSDSTTAGAAQRTGMQNVFIDGDMYPVTPKVLLPGDAFTAEARWGAAKAVSAAGVIEFRMYGYIVDLR